MSTTESSTEAASEAGAQPAPDRRTRSRLRQERLRPLRPYAIALWVAAFAAQCIFVGVPVDRDSVLVWCAAAVAALSVGRESVLRVVIDFLPLLVVLIVYDLLRGASDSFGMPTWWTLQPKIDRWLFFGHEPTVWLQEHLVYRSAHTWDVGAVLTYVSFFIAPWIVAAVLWFRDRRAFYGWSGRWVAMSFIAFTFFALLPTAPPWAAAQCTAAQVADHPHAPRCMYSGHLPDGPSLLGKIAHPHGGVPQLVIKHSWRGLHRLHLPVARAFQHAEAFADAVASFPSLHAAGAMLVAVFLWRRVHRRWRPLLAAYPIAMGFTLVYTANHYVIDVLAGYLLAVLVCVLGVRVERRIERVLARRRTAAAT